jgi:chain length determinant protein (polysaccharide antigen chain regulator)
MSMQQNNSQISADRLDDEIDLLDLWRTLMRRKLLIILTLLVVIGLAAVYLVITPRTYEVRVRLLLPKTNMIRLSEHSHPYVSFLPKTVFQEYGNELRLDGYWRQFIADQPDLFAVVAEDEDDELFQKNPLVFEKDNDYPADHFVVAFQTDVSEDAAAAVLSGYLQFVRDLYVADLLELVTDRIENRKLNVVLEIDQLRRKARLEREDEIDRLARDLAQAQKLGIAENLLIRPGGDNRSGSDVINIVGAQGTSLGYLRGTKELTTEIQMLRQRENDDPYIAGLRDKELELEQLNDLDLTTAQFQPYTIDGANIAPGTLVKPKARLVVVIALAVGLMAGVFLAFFAEFLVRVREQN